MNWISHDLGTPRNEPGVVHPTLEAAKEAMGPNLTWAEQDGEWLGSAEGAIVALVQPCTLSWQESERWYVAHRDPHSLLVGDWRLMGQAPTHAYPDAQTAVDAAIRLSREMHYDVMVITFCGCPLKQYDSRSTPGGGFDS